MTSSSVTGKGVVYAVIINKEKEKWGDLDVQIFLCEERMFKDQVIAVRPPLVDAVYENCTGRSGLAEVLQLTKNKIIDRLYVCEINQLGRNFAETLDLLFSLREYGVMVKTPSGVLTDGVSNHLPFFLCPQTVGGCA
jgi:DNA invertase Pin-like site-specific DNA recombinase